MMARTQAFIKLFLMNLRQPICSEKSFIICPHENDLAAQCVTLLGMGYVLNNHIDAGDDEFQVIPPAAHKLPRPLG